MVSPASATVETIIQKVRHLTNSPDENSLTTAYITQTLNDLYNTDFPYGIKLDQIKSVYTIYTIPQIDRYPFDVNYYQGVRDPFYVDGIQGSLYKQRDQFFNVWPKIATLFQQASQTLTGIITGIAQPTNPAQITSPNHGLTTGAVILIDNVGGMTQLNGNYYTITFINANTFSLDGIDNTAFGAYTSGGTWTSVSQSFNFAIQGPFLSQEVQMSAPKLGGGQITIADDGNGNLLYLVPNPVITEPAQTQQPIAPIPGMLNKNTANPGLYSPLTIGTVNYITGVFNFTLPSGVSLDIGAILTVKVSQYQASRPCMMLFFNNELTIRPVPDKIYKLEFDVYQTPVQFMQTTDVPILNQWWKYLAYLVAAEIQRERNDFDSVNMLMEGLKRQEALVLERQATEEIGKPNYTLFNSTQSNPYISNFYGMGFF